MRHDAGEGASASAYVTTRELAAQLGLHEATLIRWRSRGLGPAAVRIQGRSVRYRREDVNAWLQQAIELHHRTRATP